MSANEETKVDLAPEVVAEPKEVKLEETKAEETKTEEAPVCVCILLTLSGYSCKIMS
jgi:hypothetical protein